MQSRTNSSTRALRARARPLLAVILPALVLRALIPFGFMPVAGSGGPAMQLCPGVAATGGAPVGHQHEGSGHSGGSVHNLCVFAASAAAALTPVTATMPLPAANLACAAHPPTSGLHLPSILRTQSARAPPARA